MTRDRALALPTSPMRARGSARTLLALLAVLSLVLTAFGPMPAANATSESVDVIVRALPGSVDEARQLVESAGGEVTAPLDLVDGFAATVPASSMHRLADSEFVLDVSADGPVRLGGWDTGAPNSGGALHRINTKVIGADDMWRLGHTGEGIGVALIDSGVAPVDGLDGEGKVMHGPDLSFDSDVPALTNLDTYGHGTHMAGIIAGADDGLPDRPKQRDVARHFSGVAPGAHIVNVKVADGAGTADVSQIIAGIEWVITQKDAVNIRVLNLSFGTDSVQDHLIDPLAHAVEKAWHEGIVVVTAAGNDGFEGRLRNPAIDPFVIAVGGVDANGTRGTGDDELLAFSNCGPVDRPVDLVAPGKSVESLRVPGSFADTFFSEAASGDRFFRGTGTSQAAAIVSGAAALVLSQHPDLSPDQVKALLVESARPNSLDASCGDGMLDLHAASRTAVPDDATQTFERSDGSGSLEAARGSYHVAHNGEPIVGEVDVTGRSWSGGTWSGGTWSGGTWSGGTWSGGTWSGGTWSGGTWSGGTWSGGTWSGGTWSGGTWSGGTWSGGTWSGGTWSGGTWSGGTWSGGTWSGGTWSGHLWQGLRWG